jgi:hypothetical protein
MAMLHVKALLVYLHLLHTFIALLYSYYSVGLHLYLCFMHETHFRSDVYMQIALSITHLAQGSEIAFFRLPVSS